MFCRNCGKEIDPKGRLLRQLRRLGWNGKRFLSELRPKRNAGGTGVHSLWAHPLWRPQLHTGIPADMQATQMERRAIPYRTRIAAGIHAILVGALGIHNFYLGYNARGTVQLLVSVLTCGIGAVPMGIWALVEGIMLLCGSTSYDARGIPLKD